MNPLCCSRRDLLGRLGGGIANVAFLDLLNRSGLAAAKSPLAAKPQHFPAKAKAVISIFCYGGVSQVDTFDPKPELLKRQGEQMTGVGNVVASMGTPGGIMPSPWKFQKHGQCGMDISELFPHLADQADDRNAIDECTEITGDIGRATGIKRLASHFDHGHRRLWRDAANFAPDKFIEHQVTND